MPSSDGDYHRTHTRVALCKIYLCKSQINVTKIEGKIGDNYVVLQITLELENVGVCIKLRKSFNRAKRLCQCSYPRLFVASALCPASDPGNDSCPWRSHRKYRKLSTDRLPYQAVDYNGDPRFTTSASVLRQSED
uniref:Uncharacterized protein n=1 Tax=Glossina palpalis gambiensis TaxID=67801 RepID=A0A1B0ARU0_9MUSC